MAVARGKATAAPAAKANGRGSARAAKSAGGEKRADADTSARMTNREREEHVPVFAIFTAYFGYAVLIAFGYMRDAYRRLVSGLNHSKPGYAPLLSDFDDFYTRRLYRRIEDCWNRPICSGPGAYIDVMERVSSDQNKTIHLTGNSIRALNLASYNYLGFGARGLDEKDHSVDYVIEAMRDYGVSMASPSGELGTTMLHRELEEVVADYLGKEAALVYGMGYATNSSTLPALFGKGDLIVSDSLNHASIVTGARASGAKIYPFRHNDAENLEKIIRNAIADGQPRTHRPWKRIVIVVEGIYSMEGEYCILPEIVALKKKYRCYLYLDEAHSIGASGRTGRGVCEHFGVDTADVDIMMGTFTKSFASVGGYIAGSRELIDYLRFTAPGFVYANSMTPPAVQQAISALRIITGEDGTTIGEEKLTALKRNSNYFRKRLMEIGLEVYGDEDSPVVPVMLYNPAKMPAFSRECLKKGLAVVVVGFPATSLIASRARFCISAAHTIADLEAAVQSISEVADRVMIKYCTPTEQKSVSA